MTHTITPWEVKGAIDYNRLIKDFGLQPFPPLNNLPQEFESFPLFRRGIIFAHRDFNKITDAIKQIGETPLFDFREVQQNGASTTFIPTSLTGRYVSGAQLALDQNTRAPQVGISFNAEGAEIFEKLTERNVGKPLAIFLDNTLVEMPVVQQKISGGQAVITGRFTIPEANKIVGRFNAGVLPAPITLINQQTISPSLGSESLKKVIFAGILGTIMVMIFMIIYYRLLGFFASWPS